MLASRDAVLATRRAAGSAVLASADLGERKPLRTAAELLRVFDDPDNGGTDDDEENWP